MSYGYDKIEKHLFTSEPDVRYVGAFDVNELPEPLAAVVKKDDKARFYHNEPFHASEIATAWTGAAFLAGTPGKVLLNLHYMGDMMAAALSISGRQEGCQRIHVMLRDEESDRLRAEGVCISGDASHKDVRKVCEVVPSCSVYVSPLRSEIYALGAMVCGTKDIRARRVSFLTENSEPHEGERGPAFDPQLEDDRFGQLARALCAGGPVCNDMKSGPDGGSFYQAVLSMTPLWNKPVCLMPVRMVREMFPAEPLSLKCHAASAVPVLLKNTDGFRKASGLDDDEVLVRAVRPDEDAAKCLAFAYAMSKGKNIIFSYPLSVLNDNGGVLLFRWDACYKT